jgi:NADH:ubiquinone oxidoreductase subunit 2 (subunit N)
VLNAIAIVPALIVAAVGVAILLVARVLRIGSFAAVLCWLSLLGASVTLALARPEPAPELPARPPVSAVTLDGLARGTAWMALALAATCAVLTAVGSTPRLAGRYAVVLVSLAGALLACVANDFVPVIVGVPVSALSICVWQFWEAESSHERSVAVQSLVLNLFAAVCLVAGALLVSALAGTTNFAELHALPAHVSAAADHIATHSARALPLAGSVGIVLLLAGLGIPLLAAPFQVAAAEIFEGTTPWSVGLMAVLPRCAALVALIRVFVEGMPRYLSTAQTALSAVAIVTLLIGGSLAYWQTSLRRLIALVVMVQAGLMLLSLAAACSETTRPEAVRWIDQQIPGGAGAAWLVFAVDSFALLGLAAILSGLERSEGHVDDLADFTHMLQNDRWTAVAAAFLLLDLAGIPPLPGFWARTAVLRSVLSVSFPSENDFLPHQNTGYVLFALLSVVAMIAVAAPCLRLATEILFLEAPIAVGEIQTTQPSGWRHRGGLRVGAAIAAAVIVVGFAPNLGLRLAARITVPKPAAGVVAAEKAAQPVKKHRRARGGGDAESSE